MRNLALLVFSFVAFTAGSARAEDTRACAAAAEQAQRLRNAGKLLESRDQLRICARASCPSVIRKDCDAWTNEIEASLSSVVIAARDAGGNDVTHARVTIDDVATTESLDGKALILNPGAHTIRVERDGDPAVEQRIVVREGERRRLVTVVFKPSEPVVAASHDLPPTTTTSEEDHASASSPVASYVLAGVGVVALAGAAYFRVSANSDITSDRNSCAPSCDSSTLDSIHSKVVVADVSLGVGIVALGVAGYLFFTHANEPTKPPPASAHFQMTPRGFALAF